MPNIVDLRQYCSPIEDQGQLGSCTSFALAGNIEFDDKKPDGVWADVSHLFIYYNERVLENTVTSDSGANLRDGIKSLAKQGVCSESLWAYDIAKFTTKPSTACYADGLNHKITSYYALNNQNDMLTCIASGFPFVFGFTVYESFETNAVANTGIVPRPRKGERVVGGHAVCCVGYDQTLKRFLCRNSWGTGWGMKGYFTIPYDVVQNYGSDFWTIRK